MKTRPNQAMRELRKIIGRTQGEFAAMIGASKDTVASWETGRNKLSPQFARRIAMATGVKEKPLLRGIGVLTITTPFVGSRPYTVEEFKRYRETFDGRSDEETAREHMKNCVDALELIFMAAARPGGGKLRNRLPGVLDSFIQWCERTRQDFKLVPQIREQLGARRFKVTLTCTYREMRRMLKEDPSVSLAGVKDDKNKTDAEMLDVEVDAVPGWCPGRSMHPSEAVLMEAAPTKVTENVLAKPNQPKVLTAKR